MKNKLLSNQVNFLMHFTNLNELSYENNTAVYKLIIILALLILYVYIHIIRIVKERLYAEKISRQECHKNDKKISSLQCFSYL